MSQSISTFIGSKDYLISKLFYTILGFEMVWEGENMCKFKVDDNNHFYLQNYYVKEWVENTMLLWEVDNLQASRFNIISLELHQQFPSVRITAVKVIEGGREFCLIDPAGVLWHIAEFDQ